MNSSSDVEIPDVFSNCPNEYIPHTDSIFVPCAANLTYDLDACHLLRRYHKAQNFSPKFIGFLVISTFLINILCFVMQIVAFKTHGKGFRKRQIFLISRTFCAIDMITMLFISLEIEIDKGFGYKPIVFLAFIVIMDFFYIAGTYVGLSILLYIAISRPIFYSKTITLWHCFLVLIGNFLISATIAESPVTCSFQGCIRPIYIALLSITFLNYTLVLVIYVVLFWNLRRRLHHSKNMSSSTTGNLTAMKRLGFSMVAFSIANIPMLSIQTYAVANLNTLLDLLALDGLCSLFSKMDLLVQLEKFAVIYFLFWILSLVIDPVFNIVTDPLMARLWNHLNKSIKNTYSNFYTKS